jgi:hypothetical protein
MMTAMLRRPLRHLLAALLLVAALVTVTGEARVNPVGPDVEALAPYPFCAGRRSPRVTRRLSLETMGGMLYGDTWVHLQLLPWK